MSVSVAINGTALNPQPASVDWETTITGGKLDGTDATGASRTAVLRAPVFQGGTVNFNWDSFANSVLTSIVLPAPGDTQQGTGVTYSSGVVAKEITSYEAPPGGLVRGVEMRVMVVV